MHKDKSDEEIVELLKTGNKDIFAEIIDRYESKMVRYGSRYFKDKMAKIDTILCHYCRIDKGKENLIWPFKRGNNLLL